MSSTPTLPSGYIWQAWKLTDRRWFHVPCPHCGGFQPLRFAFSTVRWPEECRDPEKIERERLAWYVCQHCERKIEDSDRNREQMKSRGVWCPTGNEVDGAGKVSGPVRMDGERRGYHLNALYSPRLTWSDVAAEFLRSRSTLEGRLNFANSWRGWPYMETAAETSVDQLQARISDLPERVVPDGTLCLTAGVDVQEREVYVEVCAHLSGERQVTILATRGESLDDVARIADGTFRDAKGGTHRVALTLVDSGYRTDEVYRLAFSRPDHVRPIKGWQTRTAPISATKIERDWMGQAGGIMLWHVDTTYFKNRWARQSSTPLGEPASWSCHADPADGWLAHLCAEHKVLKRVGARVLPVWEPKPDGGPNHWFDCRVYNNAAADMLQLYAINEDEPEPAAPPKSQPGVDIVPTRDLTGAAGVSSRLRARRGRWIGRGD